MERFLSAIVAILFICPKLLGAGGVHADFDGNWEFDAAATRKYILSLPNWTTEMAQHVMSAYRPHSYSFSEGKYTLKIDDKEINGSFTGTAIRGGTMRVLFSCPEQEKDEVGEIDLIEDILIYRSHTPMFKNEALYYKKKKS